MSEVYVKLFYKILCIYIYIYILKNNIKKFKCNFFNFISNLIY